MSGAGHWGGGWALTRVAFASAALLCHLDRAGAVAAALQAPALRFTAGPLYLAGPALREAAPAWLLWGLGLMGLLGAFRGRGWARPGLLLWLGASLGLIALVGLPARVPERMAIWGVLLLCLAPIDEAGLLHRRVGALPRQLLMVVMGSLYLSTGLLKALEEPAWWSGEALAYDLVDRWHAGGALAAWLSGQSALTALLSRFTLAFELGFVLLIGLRRTNPPLLLAGLLLHAGIGLLMEVGFLGHFVVALYPALLDPEAGEAAMASLRRRLPRLSAALERWIDR
jgi:hypothetical protein